MHTFDAGINTAQKVSCFLQGSPLDLYPTYQFLKTTSLQTSLKQTISPVLQLELYCPNC